MNISSTKLHLTNAKLSNKALACKPGDCSAQDREACRAEIRDMVVHSDNTLVSGTLIHIGSLFASAAAAGFALGTLSGTTNAVIGVAGALIGGAATVGLHTLHKGKDKQAAQQFKAAFDRAEDTGCYQRDELYQWYLENFVY